MNTQKKLTDRILIKDGRYRENAVIYIPVAISEKLLNGGDSSLEVTLSNTVLDNYTKSEITNSVMESIPQLNWKDDSDIFAEVKSEYVKLVAETTKSERVKELAMKLFLSNNYQTI
jgi:hypothetical protein